MTKPSEAKRRGPRPVALILSLALLVAGLSALAGVVYMTMPGGGGLASGPSAIGGAFTLTDQTGRAITERDLKGKPSLVFFGFTHCPDICPTKLFEMTQMLDKLGTDASKVNVYFVTVDPARDTQDLMKTYLGSFHPGISGLTGTEEQVTQAMRAYRAFARKVPLEAGNYTMDHTVFVYLMDRNGTFVSTFDVARDPEQAARDLRRYM
ncbi:SCO family protein [Phreatobacter aquaticus]|uniref:SCO family protein n=1 Tax=Phreatobacter aquaticus TaxID=2570229 RepID=A0A4D7QF03_9HYPH|nr:SCO family protein [Phreatobacter aquaticus]QCK85405.1 SCO family protein [Phreatobacter aquaticus]